jgi:hypothetical protein
MLATLVFFMPNDILVLNSNTFPTTVESMTYNSSEVS